MEDNVNIPIRLIFDDTIDPRHRAGIFVSPIKTLIDKIV